MTSWKSLLWSFGTSLAAYFALRLVWEPFGFENLATDLGDSIASAAPWLVYGGARGD